MAGHCAIENCGQNERLIFRLPAWTFLTWTDWPFSIIMSLDEKKKVPPPFLRENVFHRRQLGIDTRHFVFVCVRTQRWGGGRLNQCPVVSVQGKSNSILNGSVCDYRFPSTEKLHARPSSLKIHSFEIFSLTWWNRARHPIGTSCVAGGTCTHFRLFIIDWDQRELIRRCAPSQNPPGFQPDTHTNEVPRCEIHM
jgi:hypothetical protein